MLKDPIYYHWTDAWLLLAIVYASGSGVATLDRVIASGDAINHAIFTPGEVESGLARLVAGGYIQQQDDQYRPCAKAFDYSKSGTKGRAMQSELKDVAIMLSARDPLSPEPLVNNLSYAGFSMAAYEEAVDKYQREVPKI